MEQIIVLGGGEGPIIVIRDGKIVVIHPEGPGEQLTTLVSVLRAAAHLEDAAIREGVAALVGPSIQRVVEGQKFAAA